jgi:hypothetical protein
MPKLSLTTAAVCWLLALLLFFVFTPLLAEKLWVLYLLPYWGMVAAGVVLLIVALVRAKRQFRAVVPTLVMVGLGLALFFTSGFRLGRQGYFQLRKGHYEALLEEVVRTGEMPPHSGELDEGPPLRYAFYWQRGVTDNWVAVVHDPTGLVIRVNEVRPDLENLHDPKWSEAVALFGGHLYRCEHLEGDWYLCWFT